MLVTVRWMSHIAARHATVSLNEGSQVPKSALKLPGLALLRQDIPPWPFLQCSWMPLSVITSTILAASSLAIAGVCPTRFPGACQGLRKVAPMISGAMQVRERSKTEVGLRRKRAKSARGTAAATRRMVLGTDLYLSWIVARDPVNPHPGL